MAVAEAGRAAELVVEGEVEVARLALVALSALDVRLAGADSSFRVAEWLVVVRAGRLAAAAPDVSVETVSKKRLTCTR